MTTWTHIAILALLAPLPMFAQAVGGVVPSSGGVTNGDSHDHDGGDGAQIPTAGLVDEAVTAAKIEANLKTEVILFPFFNGGSALAASSDDGDRLWVRMPFSCDITSVEVTADATGSLVVDLWKDTYANFPPDNADSITASAPPTLSSAQKSQDTTLTGWATQISAGDYITANVDSATTVTNAVVAIQCTRD